MESKSDLKSPSLQNPHPQQGDILRPYLGLTPYIEQGLGVMESLIPDRYKTPVKEEKL